MRLSECAKQLDLQNDMRCIINRDINIYSIALLPDDLTALREDVLYVSTDCGAVSRVAAMPFPKSLLCLCVPARMVLPEMEPESNLILVDPRDMTDLFMMRSQLNRMVAEDPEQRAQILEQLIRSDNMDDLLRGGYEYLGCGFVILDPSLHIIGERDFEVNHPAGFAQAIIEKLRPIDTALGCRRYNSEEHAIYLLQARDETGSQVLACQFSAEKKLIGYLLISCSPEPLPELQLERSAVFCSLVCKIMLTFRRSRIAFDAAEPFLSRLLESPVTPKAAKAGAARLNWPLYQHLYVLAAVSDSDPGDQEALSLSIYPLLSVLPNAQSFLFHRQLVAIISSRSPLNRDAEVWAEVERVAEAEGLCIGISRSFEDLTAVRRYFDQSIAAVQLSQRLELSGSLHFFESLCLFSLFSAIPDRAMLERCIHPAIYHVINYDLENESSLFETLQCYANCVGDLGGVADRLFIHRNTVKYRITKISDLMGMDITQPDNYDSIWLSLKLLEFLRHSREPGIGLI